MDFETTKHTLSSIHYFIVLVPFIVIVLYGFWREDYNVGTTIKRFYILLFSWIVLTFFFDGCPLTLIENKLAVHFWGKPFYPEYGFYDSDAYFILTYPKMYYPLFLYLVFKGVLYLSKNINN